MPASVVWRNDWMRREGLRKCAAISCFLLFLTPSHTKTSYQNVFSSNRFSPSLFTAIRVVSLSLRQPKVQTQGKVVLRDVHEEAEQQGDHVVIWFGRFWVVRHFIRSIKLQHRIQVHNPSSSSLISMRKFLKESASNQSSSSLSSDDQNFHRPGNAFTFTFLHSMQISVDKRAL